jgi:hypothetical protein
MPRQSIELGTDVGDPLRAFSDNMRDRRLNGARPVHISSYFRHCDVAGDHPAGHRATTAREPQGASHPADEEPPLTFAMLAGKLLAWLIFSGVTSRPHRGAHHWGKM